MSESGSGQAARQQMEYIERMAIELCRMAAALHAPVLAYLLEMAAEEAAIQRSSSPVAAVPAPPRGGRIPRVGRPG